MDAELKAKWVDALRSGAYEQAHGILYSAPDGTFCCLGVLCATTGVLLPQKANAPFGYDALTLMLDADQQADLMNMNDRERKTFPEIADYIEANL